jgi:hypothetical protein
MEQTSEYLLGVLKTVIEKDIKHENYKRVCELKRKYTSLITGEDMEHLMRRFDKHESQDMFNQRVRITSHITQSVAKNLIKPLYKIPRSNSVNRVITYKNDKDQERVKKFEEILSEFYGDDTLDNWFNTRWIDLNGHDPNAWCVLEWKDFDPTSETAKPYPFEVSAEEAIHFSRDNSKELQFLVVRNAIKDDFDEDTRERYTIYGKDHTIALTSLTDQEVDDIPKSSYKSGDIIQLVIENVEYNLILLKQTKWFRLNTFTHNLNFVPAFTIGFNRDLYTNGKTYLSVIDDAVPILIKMVKANSEMDLTAALHVFPQKIQYAQRCEHTGCNMGKFPNGDTCPTCGGSGYQVAKTAQDVIYITMPRDKDDFFNLDNIVKYVSPSVELVQWQDRYIEKLTIRCKEAMYNTELFSKKEVAETATGKNIDLQNVYDSLYTMAKAYSTKWKFAVTSIAKIADMDEDLVAFYNFSKDFKLKSLTDLYNDLKIVSDSGADSFVKEQIYDDIAGIVYSEDPIAKGKYEAKKAFYPFSGKSEKEIMFALSSNDIPEEVKVLYLNYGWIFDEIYVENANTNSPVNFYELNRAEQKVLIDKKIKEIISKRQPVVGADTEEEFSV